MANNYYEWLGLPIESFENDPAVLSEIVEKKIVEWQSHKKLEITNRAFIHGPQIRAAIKNPEMWEEIYREYKDQVDNNIADQLQLFVNDKLEIAAEDVETIANQNNVSAKYVKRVCGALKYKVGTDAAAQPLPQFTIDDMEPPSFRKFSSVQKLIEELGSKNLMELLARPDVLGVSISANSPNKKVIEALEQVRKKWMNVSATGSKATQKSHLDKIYSGFTKHLKTIPFSEYVDCLKFSKAKEVLTELTALKVRELSEIAFNTKVSQLFEFTEDQDKARSVLAAFCTSKGIGYPLPRAMLAMCPFCGRSFERSDPIQKTCPICGHTLMVQCPKCRRFRHIITESECDGINLGSFPLLEKALESINKDCEMLNLESARDKLNDLKSRWGGSGAAVGFPGADKAEERLARLEREYNADLARISERCRNNEFYSARGIIERIDRSFPGFKRGYGSVYSNVEYAEEEFARAIKVPDTNARIKLLLAIGDVVADFPRLNTELQKYPIASVTNLRADVDSNSGIVSLSWRSENKSDNVFYVIRRKTDTPVANESDGNEIARTQMLSFSDKTIREGVAYYYAVFAVRGPISSSTPAMNGPVIMLKKPDIAVTPKNRSIDLSWNAGSEKMRVYCSEREITQYDEGALVRNLLSSGVLIEGLTNGKPYWVAVYKYVVCGGKEYRSRLAIYPRITPLVPVDPPRFRVSRGSKDGEYILRSESPQSSDNVVLFYSEARVGIAENAAISFSEMENKAKRLDARKLSDGKYIVDMAGLKSMLVYPAIAMSGSLIVGNILTLQYIRQSAVNLSVSGNTLCVMLDEFPEGMDQIIVCYNFDDYPADSTDCERGHRISVSRAAYQRDKIVRIPITKQGEYHISVFARKGRDEMLIANKFTRLAKTEIISYTMSKALSSISITLKSEGGYIPPLTFAYAAGAVPLSKELSLGYTEFPAIPDARRTEVITFKCKLPKNAYGKLFCADSRYTLIAEGSVKLN